MWDVQPAVKQNPPSLSQRLYQALEMPGVRLRIRLRGNNLHILLEGSQVPSQAQVAPRLKTFLQDHPDDFNLFFRNTEDPVYKIILYGRQIGQQRPHWIESIMLAAVQGTRTPSVSRTSAGHQPTPTTALLSNEHLARTGAPEAIARYLSESLSHLGVSVKVLVQKLPATDGRTGEGDPPLKRLWVICSCHYSPDASLIAEPIAQQLRDLELQGFKEAIIRSQVQGEANPDWVLQVDLTHPTELLHEWARWGDRDALSRLLNVRLAEHFMETQVIPEAQTLHIFCRMGADAPNPLASPPAPVAIREVTQCLTDLQPQGMTAAAIYGIIPPLEPVQAAAMTELTTLQHKPAWVNWVPLAQSPDRALPLETLAAQKHIPALTFLLQRFLNPDIDGFLATGGIRVKLCFRETLLHIMTEAVVCPRQSLVVTKLERFLATLPLAGVTGVRIYGRRAGQSSPLWSHGSSLQPIAPAPAFAAPPVTDLEGDDVLAPALPAPTAAPTPRWSKGRALLQQAVCLTGICTPHPEATWRPAMGLWGQGQLGWHSAIAWLAVGLVGAGLADWGLQRWLSAQQWANHEREAALLSLETDLTVPTTAHPDTTAALLAAARSPNPSFNNQLLDQKLALYQSTVEQSGPPDILILGSSRALRGIDPTVLQTHLSESFTAQREVSIFNFGVNGATARVVDLMLRRILTPDQLPRVILWADGARAFNSGRPDRTYEAMEESEGYAALEAGIFPPQTTPEPPRVEDGSATGEPLTFAQLHEGVQQHYQQVNQWVQDTVQPLSFSYESRTQLQTWLRAQLSTTSLPLQFELSPEVEAQGLGLRETITLKGFLPVEQRFDPELYYLKHPRVRGDYDTDYTAFALRGQQEQALERVLRYLHTHQVAVIFVNVPMTDDYLDATRQAAETEFVTTMTTWATEQEFVFLDWGERWLTNYEFFSDPSHLNQAGAAELSQALARSPKLLWSVLLSDPEPTTVQPPSD